MTFTYHDLLKEPPSLAELQKLSKQTNETIKELVNTKSQAYKQSKPDLDAMTEQEIYELISANPRILVRPMLTNGKKLLKGFKEEQYREYVKYITFEGSHIYDE